MEAAAFRYYAAGVFTNGRLIWGWALLLLLNPKAYFIIAAMFSQFLDPMAAGRWSQILWITSIFTVNNWVAMTVWAVVGDRLAHLFRTAATAKTLNLSFGSLLGLVGLWMLFI